MAEIRSNNEGEREREREREKFMERILRKYISQA